MGCTCILNANIVHGLITVSGLPFSIHIHIDTRSAPAWFIFTPPSKAHVPAINESEIANDEWWNEMKYPLVWKQRLITLHSVLLFNKKIWNLCDFCSNEWWPFVARLYELKSWSAPHVGPNRNIVSSTV